MVVHHIINLCCCIYSSESKAPQINAHQPTITAIPKLTIVPSETTKEQIISMCPKEIVKSGPSWIALYIYIVCNGRLPTPDVEYYYYYIGNWVVTLRKLEQRGKLNSLNISALAKMPLWVSLPPLSEATPLLN